MLRIILLFFISSTFCSFVKAAVVSTPQNDENKSNINVAFQEYLKSVKENLGLDVAIILTRSKYFDDGTLQQVDTLAFAADKENDNFDVASMSQNKINDLEKAAEDKGVIISVQQEKFFDEGSNITNFRTDELEAPDSAAAHIAIGGQAGISTGLVMEVADTLDLTVNSGTIALLEFDENGKMKRNSTTTIYPQTVIVTYHEKMSARMQQSAEALLKKAYKIDVNDDDRAPIIADLFNKKFPKYKWQVLVNATHYWIDENHAQIGLKIGTDEFDILGIKHEVDE